MKLFLFTFCLCFLSLSSAFNLNRDGKSRNFLPKNSIFFSDDSNRPKTFLTKDDCPKIVCFANGKCLDMCDPGVFPYLTKENEIDINKIAM